MFEIIGNDIALLNEEDLRTLVALLCESELRRRDLAIASVTWGGDQNSSDGGLDVRVELPAAALIEGFVPRPITGFQVKKTDMPRSKILEEMRPHGILRPVIRELADKSGAYVIVSSTDSTSDSALQSRRTAMAEAVQGLPNRNALTLDFYDRTRIATWLREHPGLVLWVRERIGKPFTAWRPYGAWAYEPKGVSGEYLLDNAIRMHTGRKERDDGIPPIEGIIRIRNVLRNPGGMVRLVGLSGVGKTRLVQALFDGRVGERSLDPSLAVYTNLADGPDPQPIGAASNLIASRTRVILVVDNCPPELHRRLSELCRSSGSTLSVITVEYDITEDQPEGTEVFDLQPSSKELIESLVKRRFPALSAVDARTVADFSGGNARIAINLASTVGTNETVAGLNDEELFNRLFQQRHSYDESLLSAAQACSLVYSFHGEDISNSGEAELVRLGALVGKGAREMFRAVAELRRRDLVQQRGVWRAVLPHAIANRLAAAALQNIPLAAVEAELVNSAPERLLKSFSRRLGYLHTSMQAVAIVQRWLGNDGLLGKVGELNDLGRALFRNVAPVSPEAALSALERTLLEPDAGESGSGYVHLYLLRSLAYDATLFERCTKLMSRIAERVGDNSAVKEVQDVFVSLFKLYLSGTHATIEERVKVIKSLLLSHVSNKRALGLAALKASLETYNFISFYDFEFGARPRDHGYWPNTADEVRHWFRTVLQLVESFVSSSDVSSSTVLEALAENFRALWTRAGMHDELELLSRAISKKRFWPEGWIAVRETQHFDANTFTLGVSKKLAALETILRPKDVRQRVRSIVFSDRFTIVDLGSENGEQGDTADQIAKIEAAARELGKAVAAHNDTFEDLLADLVTREGYLWSFGIGLSEIGGNPGQLWDRLANQLTTTPLSQQRVNVFCGFLHGLSVKNPDLVERLLDDAVESDTLACWYPVLQTAVEINVRGVDRLLHSLALGKAPIRVYRQLACGRATDPISGENMGRLLLEIATRPDGFDIALFIIFMRLHSDKGKADSDPEVLSAGRKLTRKIEFSRGEVREDYHLGEVVKSCFVGEEGRKITHEVCCKIRDSVSKRKTFAFAHDDMLQALLLVQPTAALEALFPQGSTTAESVLILDNILWRRKNPFDSVPEPELLDWCDQEPDSRYPTMAAAINIYHDGKEAGPRQWTKLALRLLEKAPDRVSVLRQYIRQFDPRTWSGSRASVVEANAKLLDELESHDDPVVTRFVAEERVRLNRLLEAEARLETATDKARDERFE